MQMGAPPIPGTGVVVRRAGRHSPRQAYWKRPARTASKKTRPAAVPLWDQIKLKSYAALPLQNGGAGMVNCTGAGDSMVAGMVAAMVKGAATDGGPLVLSAECVGEGLLAAQLSVECDFAVSPLLGKEERRNPYKC